MLAYRDNEMQKEEMESSEGAGGNRPQCEGGAGCGLILQLLTVAK